MTENEWRKQFAGKLSHMIKARGCTQSEIAEEAGISEKALSNYVCGVRVPKANILANLVIALDCDANDLINFDDEI